MARYKSDKKWHNHTDSEKKVILCSFPNYLFLTKEEHARRVYIEESIFNMIVDNTSTLPEQSGLFSENDFIVFWEDEDSKANIDKSFIEGLGLSITKIYSEADTGNAMAGIATWQHNVYLKIR